jgi:hypothetical protein
MAKKRCPNGEHDWNSNPASMLSKLTGRKSPPYRCSDCGAEGEDCPHCKDPEAFLGAQCARCQGEGITEVEAKP